MNFNFLKSLPRKNIFLSIDIGTEAIKALIFSVASPGDKITIISSALEYFDKYGAFEIKNLQTDCVARALLKVIPDLKRGAALSLVKKELKESIQNQKKWQVVLTLSPSILKARISRQNFLRQDPKLKINKTEEKAILDQVLVRAKAEVFQDSFAGSTKALPQDIYWISSEIINKKIDGYQVGKLESFEGKSAELEILNIFSLKYYIEEIKKVFNELNLEILKIAHAVENVKYLEEGGTQSNFYIDVGGQATQFFLSDKGVLKQIGEFDSGGRKFTETLSQDLGVSEDFARELKEKYSAGETEKASASKIRNLFEPDESRWFLLLKAAFAKISGQDILPQNIRLYGGACPLPEIKECLEDRIAEEAQNLPNNKVDIKIIYPSDLKNVDNFSKSVKNSQFLGVSLNCFCILNKNNL